MNVLYKRDNVFSDKPGKINFMEYDISMEEGVRPKACVPYKVPFSLRDKVKTQLDSWLEQGIIRECNGEYASPIVIVKNADGTIRITVDYRAINPHIKADNFPMPHIDTVLERLSEAKFVSKIDLTKAFLQIPLSDRSCKFTSFVTDYGQFEFTVVPFGIKFATGVCNRIIKKILKGCETFVDSFVDDLVVFSSNFEDHVNHLRIVLDKLMEVGITLNKKKCSFGYREIKFLGFVVGNGKISPDQLKLKAISDFPKPVVKKDMRAFVGLLNFYRRFAPNLASYVAPLNDALKKNAPDRLIWSHELLTCFIRVKELMVNSTPLYIPRKDCKFIVQTDACDIGISAVLWQVIGEEERPVSFISRKLSKFELNYAIIEKECLAIKWAIERFHDYLYGCKFVVRTDHAPLQWLQENKNTTSRRMRWALSLQSYDFTVEYVKAKDNFLADLFSRYPLETFV